VAGINLRLVEVPGQFEPPHRITTVGIIRACQKNGNGTSNLLLQGICRVEIMGIVSDEPYRRIRIRALASQAGASDEAIQSMRREVSRLLNLKRKFAAASAEMAAFLKTVEDPEAFADIAAYSLCEDPDLKQRLLETLDVHRRLELLGGQLRKDIAELKLLRKLQGRLPDERISDN